MIDDILRYLQRSRAKRAVILSGEEVDALMRHITKQQQDLHWYASRYPR